MYLFIIFFFQAVFFIKQKTVYEIYRCDLSPDVRSSDLALGLKAAEVCTSRGALSHAGKEDSAGSVSARHDRTGKLIDTLTKTLFSP